MPDATIGAINHITFSVSELDRAFDFYVYVLGCRPLARWRRGAYLLAGDASWICLLLDERTDGEPLPTYTHTAFTVSRDAFVEITRRLHDQGASIWQEDSSEGDSTYFLDPDGHELELHVGDWKTRLAACREQPYEDMRFY